MNKNQLNSKFALLFSAFLVFTLQNGFSQDRPDYNDNYLIPPESISEEILASNHLNVTLDEMSPNGDYFLNRKRIGITPLSNFAKPYYNIAGLQIDRKANRSRSLTTQRATIGLELVNTRNGEKRELETPDDVTISNTQWSPDGSKIAWLGHAEDATHLYVTDVRSGSTRQVTRRPVLATLNTNLHWAADNLNIFTVLIPEGRGSEPVRPDTPTELKVRTTSVGENRLRTYQSLLEDSFEGELLEYYITGQLARIDIRNRRARNIGEPAMIRSLDPAPSGEHVVVQTLQKPFSYIVPLSRFSWNEEIWDLDGEVLVTLRFSETNEGIPDHDTLEDHGRNDIQWRPDGDGLSLILKPEDEKEDEENEEENEHENEDDKADEVNRVIQWFPPFENDDQNVIYESKEELSSVRYSESGDILFITKRNNGNEHLYAYYTDQPDTTYTLYNYDTDEFYDNPGNLSFYSSETGVSAVRISDHGDSVFLRGTEYFEEVEEKAPRPFIDRVDIHSSEKERIFQSSEEYYELVSSILDRNANELVIRRQSATVYPNYWHVDLSANGRTQLTENVDYNEAVSQAQRNRFKVKRADGIEFWVDVVMPAEWDGEPLAGLIWHYPREYDDQDDYNESLRRHNKNSYPTVAPRTPDIFVKEGYAVLKPDWPIVGEQGTSNDNFVWSIVQNSTAVIDSSEAKGYIDRSKMAIGGHSYGAFGSANAMIHTSFFKAGIAGSGNYNRTLTPLGFQRERNDLWRGMDRYLQMSPIFWADRLDGAFLMYHGEEDQNVGTWPINSDRMFHALNGMNKTAVLYKYPHEAHGPAAEETLLDMWKRWVDWLDVHVKN